MSAENAKDYAQHLADTVLEASEIGDPYEFVSDVLDIRRTYSSSGDLFSVSLLVAFGGPNAWLHVQSNGIEVEVSWYSDPAVKWVYCPDFADAILELFNDWDMYAARGLSPKRERWESTAVGQKGDW